MVINEDLLFENLLKKWLFEGFEGHGSIDRKSDSHLASKKSEMERVYSVLKGPRCFEIGQVKGIFKLAWLVVEGLPVYLF